MKKKTMVNLVRSTRRQVLGVVAGVLSLVGAGTTQADEINGLVDIWSVEVSGEFLCDTAVFNPGTSGTSCSTQSMNWGSDTGSGQSGLDIANLPEDQVLTNGPLVANTSVTHTNNPITGNSLDMVTLASTLVLTPFDPTGTGFPPATVEFVIDFFESPNGDEPCANGELNNEGVNVNGCADIFVLDQTALNFPFYYDLDGDGPLQGHTYYISFFELTNGLTPLSDASCIAAGAQPGCFGFETPEQATTTFQFAATITSDPIIPPNPVPAPATLWLFGISLLGLGWFSRRRG